MSIIIVGYNEAPYIREKINSFLEASDWIDGSEIIVVSGGSTDNTSEIVREFEADPRIKTFLYANRVAKIEGVNLAVSKAKNEFLVFSDCRQKMKPGSVRKLMANFQDESVGTVTATLIDSHLEGNCSFIRSLLNRVAIRESASGSALNVFGALYAQRKSVYRAIPGDVLFDDLFVTVSTINQGNRLVQEREAVIFDVPFKTYYKDERIKRLARGLLIFLHLHRKSIFKLPFTVLLRLFIYKYLKLFIPFALPLLILSGICSAFLVLPPLALLGLLSAFAFTTLIPEFRAFLALNIRVNYYFAVAVFKFYFRNERSIVWQKLNATPETSGSV